MSGFGCVCLPQSDMPHDARGWETTLWNIFLVTGRWEQLVEGTWLTMHPDTLWASASRRWGWADNETEVSEEHLARWLGMFAGITADRARLLLEPYAHRQ